MRGKEVVMFWRREIKGPLQTMEDEEEAKERIKFMMAYF